MASSELDAWSGRRVSLPMTYEIRPLNKKRLPAGAMADPYVPDNGVYIEYVEETIDRSVTDDDSLDYKIAAACGVLSGAIDSFFTGAFSLDRANEWGSTVADEIVIRIAKHEGFPGDTLAGAISFLERNHPFAGDAATAEFGGGLQHHLRDFSHHFSVGGLFFSLLTQFTGRVFGTDAHGVFIAVNVQDSSLIGKDLTQKLFLGTVNWLLHMASDMAGSSGTPGKGTGIPGPLLSLIKEMSALPIFKDAMLKDGGLRQYVAKLFNGTLLKTVSEDGEKTYRRFNLRTEIGLIGEIGRQAIPVLCCECMVRACYAVHHLYHEIQTSNVRSISDLNDLNWEKVLPFNNHQVARMITIASGIFSVIDIADATIRSVISNGPSVSSKSIVDFALSINYIGLIRFGLAVAVDVKMIWESRNSGTEQQTGSEFEHAVSGFEYLVLNQEQTEILYSMERLAVSMDIERSKQRDIRLKENWLDQWTSMLPKQYMLLSQDEIKHRIAKLNSCGSDVWLHLVALELSQFMPYMSLTGNDQEKRKSFKFDDTCRDDVFHMIAPEFGNRACSKMNKEFNRSRDSIDGNGRRKIAAAVGTVAVVAGTAGTAAVFAPVIAPVIAGYTASTAVAGLSGAALTSASLAALGGGALAAGGFGMAGGTAVIAGGGAVLGLTGSGGVAAIFRLIKDESGVYTLQECSKLLTFCRNVLIHRDGGDQIVECVRRRLIMQISQVNDRRSVLSGMASSQKTGDDAHAGKTGRESKKLIKKDIEILDKSLKYLRRCERQLYKLVKGRKDSDTAEGDRDVSFAAEESD